MKPTTHFIIAFATLLMLTAEPAMAQSIDLSPIQDLLQGDRGRLDRPARRCHRDSGRARRLPELVL